MERVQIDLENEYSIEQFRKALEVPAAAAEERRRVTLIGRQGPHLFDVPDMVLVGEAIQRLTGFGITLISQLPVAVDGVVATPLQLIAH